MGGNDPTDFGFESVGGRISGSVGGFGGVYEMKRFFGLRGD